MRGRTFSFAVVLTSGALVSAVACIEVAGPQPPVNPLPSASSMVPVEPPDPAAKVVSLTPFERCVLEKNTLLCTLRVLESPRAPWSLSAVQRNEVVLALGTEPVTQISGGYDGGCAVTGGRVVCWSDRHEVHEVPGLTHVTQVAYEPNHACARDAAGAVWCWGRNLQGALGTKLPQGVSVRMQPEKVALDQPVEKVFVGESRTCVLLASGALSCWGSEWPTPNDAHHRNGSSPSDSNPREPYLAAELPDVRDVISVFMGANFGCGLRRHGEVSCWGDNSKLQRGTSKPVVIPRASRVAVPPTKSLVTGPAYVCALLQSGEVQCWGDNSLGQLGNGSLQKTAGPSKVVGVSGAIAIRSTGDGACVLDAQGQELCWGRDDAFQEKIGSPRPRRASRVSPEPEVGALDEAIAECGGPGVRQDPEAWVQQILAPSCNAEACADLLTRMGLTGPKDWLTEGATEPFKISQASVGRVKLSGIEGEQVVVQVTFEGSTGAAFRAQIFREPKKGLLCPVYRAPIERDDNMWWRSCGHNLFNVASRVPYKIRFESLIEPERSLLVLDSISGSCGRWWGSEDFTTEYFRPSDKGLGQSVLQIKTGERWGHKDHEEWGSYESHFSTEGGWPRAVRVTTNDTWCANAPFESCSRPSRSTTTTVFTFDGKEYHAPKSRR